LAETAASAFSFLLRLTVADLTNRKAPQGVLKAIGVSNFQEEELSYLLANSRIKPAVNQIESHPGKWNDAITLIAAKKRGKTQNACSSCPSSVILRVRHETPK